MDGWWTYDPILWGRTTFHLDPDRDNVLHHSNIIIGNNDWVVSLGARGYIIVRATLTLSSLVTEGRTTLSNRAIQLHPKLILPC